MRLRKQLIGLFALVVIVPTVAHAALLNINTADATLLDTLPGIGPTKAQAIIDYRTANGPFARIENIQDVSGIGPSTYADIALLITVGDIASPPSGQDVAASSTPSTAATTTTTISTSGAPPEYIPIPTLRIIIDGDRTVSSGADTAFTAAVYDGKGNRRDDALVTWAFGDGMQRTGASVFHRYYHPGAYLVVVRATTSDGGTARKEIRLTAKDAGIRIVSASAQGIALANEDARTLDLSFWRLSAGGKEFKLPEGTQILSGSSIVFPPQITGLSAAGAATLLYPSGEMAAAYPVPVETVRASAPAADPEALALSADRQPSAPTASYKDVQKVESIIGTKGNAQTHEEEVSAPREIGDAAISRGAALPPAEVAPSGSSSLFRSPWTISFFGVMALAGAAFIFL